MSETTDAQDPPCVMLGLFGGVLEFGANPKASDFKFVRRNIFNSCLQAAKHCPNCNEQVEFTYLRLGLPGIQHLVCTKCQSKYCLNHLESGNDLLPVPLNYQFGVENLTQWKTGNKQLDDLSVIQLSQNLTNVFDEQGNHWGVIDDFLHKLDGEIKLGTPIKYARSGQQGFETIDILLPYSFIGMYCDEIEGYWAWRTSCDTVDIDEQFPNSRVRYSAWSTDGYPYLHPKQPAESAESPDPPWK